MGKACDVCGMDHGYACRGDADGTQPGPMLRYGVAAEANRLGGEVK